MVFHKKYTNLYPNLVASLDDAGDAAIVSSSARLPTWAAAYALQSADNSTTTPMLADAIYTGTSETTALPEVAVSVYADVPGTLFLQYKNPGSNLWHAIPSIGFYVPALTHVFASGLKMARSFRAKFVNGASDQTTFELFTYYGSDFVSEAGYRRASTGATTTVASTTSPVTIIAGTGTRLGASITNTDANALYLLLGAGTVSASLYTASLATGETYEIPYAFTGVVSGVWAGDGAGGAMITDFTL